ncbi:hypothetical protein Pan265_01050 [Mucisphaera calidilacus]|uniref:Uncharacterized protein n=2 Tax=Mucisphaera calidilacus TaxID=2527982 RepID=A0A518BTH6_9BACT|nr:hypothetical protein Pan265_01050 [Mucisphaera calidilacus]
MAQFVAAYEQYAQGKISHAEVRAQAESQSEARRDQGSGHAPKEK